MVRTYIEQNLFTNPNALVSVTMLLNGYRIWALRNSAPALTRTQFIAELEAAGYIVGKHHDAAAVVGLSYSNEPRFKVVDGVIYRNPSYSPMAAR